MFKLLKLSVALDLKKLSCWHSRKFAKFTKEVDVKNIRNIGIIAHIDAGKTTTTERMLYYSGFTNAIGDVDDGDTVMDYMQQERDRGITITSAAITFKWKGNKINLIDTPGHVDFTIEVERSMCAIDGGVIILDASAGVEVQTLTVWKQANRYAVPCIVYLNKMDKGNANFEMSVASLEEKLKVKPLILHLPIGSGKTFKGVVDIVSGKKVLWDDKHDDGNVYKAETIGEDELKTLMEINREQLIEDVADLDDVFAEKMILQGPESLSNEDLCSAIRRITLGKAAVPVFCGSSYKNIGVQLLMNSVIMYLPNPLDRKRGFELNDKLFALVFKIIYDKKKDPLTFLRLYSGSIKKGQSVYNINRGKYEKITKLMVPLANEFDEIELATANNIAVVAGLKEAITGDIFVPVPSDFLEDKDKNVISALSMHVPDPVFFCTIEAPSVGSEKQLEFALKCLQREDPTFKVENDEELGQTIISGMGELHIEVMKERIHQEYGVASYLGPLQVAYREAVSARCSDTYILDKTLAGTKHFVKITLAIYPNPNGGKFENVKVVVTKENELGVVRPDHLKFINTGINSALNHGPTLGFPVIDTGVSLLWLEVARGTSLPMITAAASHCITQILKHTKVTLLEPIMKLCITSSSGYAGTILNNLVQKRSQILGLEPLKDNDIIYCRTPLSELRGYSTELRAMTSGMATFTMEFDCYEEMSSEEKAKAVEEVTGFAPM